MARRTSTIIAFMLSLLMLQVSIGVDVHHCTNGDVHVSLYPTGHNNDSDCQCNCSKTSHKHQCSQDCEEHQHSLSKHNHIDCCGEFCTTKECKDSHCHCIDELYQLHLTVTPPSQSLHTPFFAVAILNNQPKLSIYNFKSNFKFKYEESLPPMISSRFEILRS